MLRWFTVSLDLLTAAKKKEGGREKGWGGGRRQLAISNLVVEELMDYPTDQRIQAGRRSPCPNKGDEEEEEEEREKEKCSGQEVMFD